MLQHQFAIEREVEGSLFLATKGIWICTGWYGWDSKNKVAFLCHFDRPRSALSVTGILDRLSEYVPVEHHFNSVLIGGKQWFWSPKTRKRVELLAKKHDKINIDIVHGQYDNLPFSKRDLTLLDAGGRPLFDRLSGRSHLKGYKWFFEPMQEVDLGRS